MKAIITHDQQSKFHRKKTDREKEAIRSYTLQLGGDVVGFAAIEDFRSLRSPVPESILPGVQSIIVIGFHAFGRTTGVAEGPDVAQSVPSANDRVSIHLL